MEQVNKWRTIKSWWFSLLSNFPNRIEKNLEKELVDEKVADTDKAAKTPVTKVAEDRTVINNGGGAKSLIKDLPKSVEDIGI